MKLITLSFDFSTMCFHIHVGISPLDNKLFLMCNLKDWNYVNNKEIKNFFLTILSQWKVNLPRLNKMARWTIYVRILYADTEANQNGNNNIDNDGHSSSNIDMYKAKQLPGIRNLLLHVWLLCTWLIHENAHAKA